MVTLDTTDIGILISLWEQGYRSIELDGNIQENRRRLYRLKRLGLCGCSRGFDSQRQTRETIQSGELTIPE